MTDQTTTQPDPGGSIDRGSRPDGLCPIGDGPNDHGPKGHAPKGDDRNGPGPKGPRPKVSDPQFPGPCLPDPDPLGPGSLRPADTLSHAKNQRDPRPVALVLGAAVWDSGPSPALVRRARRATALWQSGAASHVIACGGTGRHPPAEALAIRDLMVADGVPAAAISAEARSTNTRQNIGNALPILAARGARDVIIVTDLWHGPRARLIARRLGLRATSVHPSLRGTHPGRQARMALREALALAWHWIAFRP